MVTPKRIFTGSLLFAYLLVGSGNYYVANATKHDARRDTLVFASTLPRKVYRYSVVPGGVYSPEELAAARRSDPVVAAHFADFGPHTWLTTLQEDLYVYVGYRMGDQVRYTKKKHKVCKGEVVITDGKNYARTRCANRLTKVFKPPALAFDEPTAPQFDYIDPPSSPDIAPTDTQLTSSYNGLPDTSSYAPPSQLAQSGASAGPPGLGNAYGPSEVILPQLLPFGALSPVGFLPVASTTPTPPITPPITPPPPPVVVPEPAGWPFVLAFSAILLMWGRNKKKLVA